MSKDLASAFALSVAALFMASCEKSGAKTSAPGAGGATVECMGINECKGQGACDVKGSHKCAGENECKGKGWIQVPQEECDAKGGTVL